MFARNKIAAVVLSLVDYPLHYDYDLNYIVEVVRGIESPATPWQSIRSELGKYTLLFKNVDAGKYDLVQSNLSRKQFVISKIGQFEYDQIVDALNKHHFLDENEKLNWKPYPQYRHLVSEKNSTQPIHPQKIIQEKSLLAGKGDFSQWKYVLVAYALKGTMTTDEATNYLCNVINIKIEGDTPERSINMYVAQNEKNSQGRNHRGNWYIRIDNGLYRLDCSQDLETRISYVKYAKYHKYNSRVFSDSDFEKIIQEFLNKDLSLNKDTILEYCKKETGGTLNVNAIASALQQIDLSDLASSCEKQILENTPKNTYTRNEFLSQVFIQESKYNSLVRMLKAKKNIILQGAPGVGKTFAARRLAYSIMGVKDDSRIEFVQFHQNYSYEDFVMGYKPNENGFELKNGIFYSFCQKAASAPDKDYFFIIDEINRGNMSKIFGELLMLIEKDYRGTPLTLAYDGRPFFVPKNLHIIGMMNTADRSLAMIDYALRRRFSFFDMEPGFDSDGFIVYQQDLNSEKLDRLVAELKSLNNAIVEDKSLGKGFCIGHSYLCGEEICTDEWLQSVVHYDILPMLAEYWFDELDKYDEWKKRLTDAVK